MPLFGVKKRKFNKIVEREVRALRTDLIGAQRFVLQPSLMRHAAMASLVPPERLLDMFLSGDHALTTYGSSGTTPDVCQFCSSVWKRWAWRSHSHKILANGFLKSGSISRAMSHTDRVGCANSTC